MRKSKIKLIGLKDYNVPNIAPDFHVGNIIEARVQREDMARWAQTEDIRPKIPYVKPVKRELEMVTIYALARQLLP